MTLHTVFRFKSSDIYPAGQAGGTASGAYGLLSKLPEGVLDHLQKLSRVLNYSIDIIAKVDIFNLK